MKPNKYKNVFSSFKLYPLSFGVLLVFSPCVSADDYFDPRFLRANGESNTVDLSAFSKKGGVEEGVYTVSVFVNGKSVGQHTLNFERNKNNAIFPVLTPTLLEEWGVRVANVPQLKDLPKDKPVDDISALIPQSSAKLLLSQLRLDMSFPQIVMSQHYTGYADPSLWNNGIPAFVANYSLSGGQTTALNTTNNNIFMSLRMGANAGPWRLRSNAYYSYADTSGENSQSTSSRSNTQFTNTYLARDIRTLRSTLMMGESQTGADIFDSIPFRGVKLSSNEQMQPSQLRGFAPAITGVANSNARITVRQNGNVVYETYVAPGPFSIDDIQQSGMSGDYDVTVTETDGTSRKFIVPYSSLPVMLRPHGWKYEVTGGRYDGKLTSDSRRADFVQGTAIYGLPRNITLFGGSLVARDYQALSIGTGISLGYAGALSADITNSNSKFQDERTLTGQSFRVRYSKSMVSTGTSVDLTAMRYSTKNYYTFNEFNSEGYHREDDVSPWTLQRRRSSFQTQVSQQLDKYGSLNFRYTLDRYWGSQKQMVGMSMGYNTSIKGITVGVNYNIDRVKNDFNQWPENRQVNLNVSVPFSILGDNRNYKSMYATTSVSHNNNGRVTNYTGLSGNSFDGLLNYSANQSWGNQDQSSNSNANIGYQGSKANLSAGYSYSNAARSMNMSASGGLLVHQDGITLSRPFGESIALVSAPGAAGVSVNGGSAYIDSRGYAVAPYLTDYSKNSIGLDPTTLPDDVDLVQTNINVYPTNGAVVKASFITRVGYKVLMTLKYNQNVVPFGAIASLLESKPGGEVGGIVGDNGQVYLAGLPELGKLLVKWGGGTTQQCTVKFDLSKIKLSKDMALRQYEATCQGTVKTSISTPSTVFAPVNKEAKPSSEVKNANCLLYPSSNSAVDSHHSPEIKNKNSWFNPPAENNTGDCNKHAN